MTKIPVVLFVAAFLLHSLDSGACTGITLVARDGSRIVARTSEWGGSVLNSVYVVSPRGHVFTSFTPDGVNGLKYTAKYGYVGISVGEPEMMVDGMNEAGLAAGLFFFPGYGKYESYDSAEASSTLADMQFVSWVLANFSTIDEMESALCNVRIVSLDERIGTVHWRIAEPGGRQVVLEIIDGQPMIYENKLGVLTNSPGFEWQMTNLNNYVNLYAGSAPSSKLNEDVVLKQFGAGAGMLGIPGDVTPPSRFVRAAFYQATAPQYATGHETAMLGFQILSNFNIPIGVEHKPEEIPEGLPSATQWTVAADQSSLEYYYRTAWNSSIRCIDLKNVDFAKVKYQSAPLDKVKEEPVEYLKIR